ncbi:Arm DNA-binding domain-containing protein [Trinickia acidisoli]|uniref:Arm DNA-binding domain-containing protein n=1 Tax=Trinickia acidisoli TaxID=2767482 RepID=UPI0035AC07DD
MGQLTDLQVKKAEHRTREYFLADGDGLYLRVHPTRKVWVYRYMRIRGYDRRSEGECQSLFAR